MSDTHIIFDGSNGISSDTFVRITRQRSLAEGKEKDDEWIALSAASCLEGEALDWYELQPEETQESWKLLRRALLIRWPRATAIAASPSRATLSYVNNPFFLTGYSTNANFTIHRSEDRRQSGGLDLTFPLRLPPHH